MSNPRPTVATEEMRLAAAARIVAELVKNGQLTPNEVFGAAEDIAKQGRWHDDGYSLAKALDDSEGWECNLDMAETLDGFSHELRSEVEKAQKAWFEAEKPEPPFPVGTRVSVTWGRKAETGTIDGIDEHGVAKYLVKIDGDPDAAEPRNARAIINWEACSTLPDSRSNEQMEASK